MLRWHFSISIIISGGAFYEGPNPFLRFLFWHCCWRSCVGCTIHINPSAGITTNDSFHYSTYDNAADYTAGRFTYQAEDIRAVRVYWVAGSIDLIEKNSAELSVSDSADNRSQEAQLHSLLRDGILTIHYCASDYRGEMQSEWKQLTIEIPSGIELTIENVSAPIRAAALSTPQLLIATVSGDISIGSLVGENAEFDTSAAISR